MYSQLRGTEPERVEKATPFIPPRPTDAVSPFF